MARRRPPRPTVIVVTPASANMSDLLNVSGASPDARLIAACDRYLYLEEQAELTYRLKGPGHITRYRAIREELDPLEVEIIDTAAHTHVGRCAKAEVGILVLGTGTWGNVAKSALRDFQSMAGAA